MDESCLRDKNTIEQYIRLVKGRNANLCETENHITNQRQTGDEVALITFFAEKFGFLNDQILSESSIPQLQQAVSMNEARREEQRSCMTGMRADLDIVHQNLDILEFGPNNEEVLSGTAQITVKSP